MLVVCGIRFIVGWSGHGWFCPPCLCAAGCKLHTEMPGILGGMTCLTCISRVGQSRGYSVCKGCLWRMGILGRELRWVLIAAAIAVAALAPFLGIMAVRGVAGWSNWSWCYGSVVIRVASHTTWVLLVAGCHGLSGRSRLVHVSVLIRGVAVVSPFCCFVEGRTHMGPFI